MPPGSRCFLNISPALKTILRQSSGYDRIDVRGVCTGRPLLSGRYSSAGSVRLPPPSQSAKPKPPVSPRADRSSWLRSYISFLPFQILKRKRGMLHEISSGRESGKFFKPADGFNPLKSAVACMLPAHFYDRRVYVRPLCNHNALCPLWGAAPYWNFFLSF